MKTNRISTRRSNRHIAGVLAYFLLIIACSSAQAQKNDAKSAIFTVKTRTNFAFGRVPLGNAVQKTFYYQNTGSDTLFIQSLELSSDSVFTIQFATLTLAPNGKGKVVVQFAPASEQFYDARLSFYVANGVAAPTLALCGTGKLSSKPNSTAVEFADTAAFAAKRSGGTQRKEMP